jgi:DMSO/TMAO reductase YedYZ molybdopterin-dependent catalytic subunit
MKITRVILGLVLLVLCLSGCARTDSLQNIPLSTTPTITVLPSGIIMPSMTPTPSVTEAPTGTSTAELSNTIVATQPTLPMMTQVAATTSGACQLDPVSQPLWPTDDLQANALDPESGLHVTGRPQPIDLATYRLKVTGLVNNPLSLTYDELRCLPKVTDSPELICPGVFIDEATWTGVPIKDILELAVVQPGATKLVLVSADGYEVNLSLETAMAGQNFLAYEVNGKTLPVRHGFPLRAVLPSMWGSYWLKWLVEIQIS